MIYIINRNMGSYIERKIKKLRKIRNLLLLIFIVEIIVEIILLMLLPYFLEDQISPPVIIDPIVNYNYTWESYAGTNRGSSVKMLCKDVIVNNLEYADHVERLIVIKEGKVYEKVQSLTEDDNLYFTTKEYIESIQSKILSGHTYNITLGYDINTGIVTAIGIEEIIKEEGENINVEK